jgi:hypothetical protein
MDDDGLQNAALANVVGELVEVGNGGHATKRSATGRDQQVA